MQEYDAELRAVPYFEPVPGAETKNNRQCSAPRAAAVPTAGGAEAAAAPAQSTSAGAVAGAGRVDAGPRSGRLCGKNRGPSGEFGAASAGSASSSRSPRSGHMLSRNGSRRATRGQAHSRSGTTGCASKTAEGGVNHPKDFARMVLRIVLEVLDRRRPATQLAECAAPPVLAALRTLVTGDHAPGRRLGPAVLSRVHVVAIDEHTAEVCASYQRGTRCFALAARIARSGTSGWRLTALRVV